MTENSPREAPFAPQPRPAAGPPKAPDPAKEARKDDALKTLAPAPEHASRLSTPLEKLAETAKDYARGAKAENTNRAYAADWRHFSAWARRRGFSPLPPDSQVVGLYLAACASDAALGARGQALAVRSIERRLSALAWQFAQRGLKLDRHDRHIAEVMAGIRRKHGRPPDQKEAVLAVDLLAMLATLDHELRGLRDRAILLVGFAGGLRRSEIVGLDCGPGQTEDASGWAAIEKKGLLVQIKGKTGWREVEIGRGSSEATCPVAALERWLKFARISHGPLFRRVGGAKVGADRLTDKHVARLVQRTALAAGVRGDLSEGERKRKFAGHSLRAGLASSAEVDERYVQKQLGHASAEMTRRYQRRRDKFRVNLTKAAGL
ncbi:tyrosine-type recombinase/integrase [Methylocapsa acidiphila]|uniref:tyrosine-type recombinase/integrase n=1 Tax=Methylocapsa acidiphila TaxID=133552 RepID=UPI0012EC2A58|nr:tyrosine-type recombinase/integrase [Methylocapsa acidiphila]